MTSIRRILAVKLIEILGWIGAGVGVAIAIPRAELSKPFRTVVRLDNNDANEAVGREIEQSAAIAARCVVRDVHFSSRGAEAIAFAIQRYSRTSEDVIAKIRSTLDACRILIGVFAIALRALASRVAARPPVAVTTGIRVR